MNFQRYRKAHLKLNDAGRVLVDGENGTGKSTLVDAICWCLYDQTTHEPSAQGDDVINEKRGKNCEVEIDFIVDGDNYVVTRRRGWKKGGKAVQLLFTSNGEALTQGTIKDTQRKIEKVIGLSYTAFRASCVFGQGRSYRFSRLTDSEKKAVLDEMLGSEIYAKAGEKASQRVNQLEDDRMHVVHNQSALAQMVKDSKARIVDLKRRQGKEVKRYKKARKLAKRGVVVVQRMIDQHVPRIDVSKAVDLQKQIEREERKLYNEVREARSELKLTTQEQQAQELFRKAALKRNNTDCVTCGQRIGARHTEEQLAVHDKKLKKLSAKYDEGVAKTVKLDAAWKQAVAKYDEAAILIRDAQSKNKSLDDLERRLADAKRDVKQLVKADSSAELITKERKLVKVRKARVDVHTLKLKHIDRQLKHYQFWQHGFSAKGLRSLMLDSTLPYLNAKLERYTNALTGGAIKVEFRTQRKLKGGGLREDFHIDVQNKHGATKYNMNSIGERAKIDIIVGLALQDMAASRSRVPINVAFFDECFDGLDAKGVDAVVGVLSELERESTFVITHNSELKAFFNRTIRVEKQDGESVLVQS